MARKLLNFCLAWTLVLGCWGGVIAAVACPHVGCETMSAAADGNAAHGEHSSAEGHESAAPEEHSAHTDDHEGHAAEPTSHGQSQPDAVKLTAGVSGAHDPRCTHCVGGSGAPPSSKFERQTAPVNKAGKGLAAHAALKVVAPAAAHAGRLMPAQHAPPGVPDRLLLLSVFRI